MTLNLKRTKKAIEAHDAAHAWYDANHAGLSFGDCWKALNALDKAGEAVGEAFAKDTADRNASDTAKRTRPDPWLRGLVARYA